MKSMKFEVDSSIEKSMILIDINHDDESGDIGTVAFESQLMNQKLRKLICGWKSWL